MTRRRSLRSSFADRDIAACQFQLRFDARLIYAARLAAASAVLFTAMNRMAVSSAATRTVLPARRTAIQCYERP